MDEDFSHDFDQLVTSYEKQDLMLFEPAAFTHHIKAKTPNSLNKKGRYNYNSLPPLPAGPDSEEINSLRNQISKLEATKNDQLYQIDDLQKQISELEAKLRAVNFETPNSSNIIVTRKTTTQMKTDTRKTRLPTPGGSGLTPEELHYRQLYDETKKKYDAMCKELQSKGKIHRISTTNLRQLPKPN